MDGGKGQREGATDGNRRAREEFVTRKLWAKVNIRPKPNKSTSQEVK